ncbi:hypothetical protein [Asanoa sp. NPDC050611]|uniref:hypothetical protein n=1 Tax=Asanoa sp. NPDC050611 TaxID=3157098 RepID=UPI0033E24B12
MDDDLTRLRALAEAPDFPRGVTTLAADSLTFALSLEVCQLLAGGSANADLTEHADLIRHTATILEIPDEGQAAAAVAELRHHLTDLSHLLEEKRLESYSEMSLG